MEIRVNKTKQEQTHKKLVEQILSTAREFANNGIDRFYYNLPEGIGLTTYQLIDMVEKATNETVYGGYKCVNGRQIKFTIRD